MTLPSRSAPLMFSTACGLLMSTATVTAAHGFALLASLIAVLAVIVGTLHRPAATLAVVCTVIAILLTHPTPLTAALAGASATAYLVLRHNLSTPRGYLAFTRPTIVAATGFWLAGLIAASIPLRMPGVILAGPVIVWALYALTIRPFVD